MLPSIDIDVLRQEAELARLRGRDAIIQPDVVLALLDRVHARSVLREERLEERIEGLEDDLRDERDAHQYWEARAEEADDFYTKVTAKLERIIEDLRRVM